MSGHGGQRPAPRSAEHLLKRMQVDSLYTSRRPVPHSASDLLGPGIASKAVRTFDWNADELLFNGLFYSEPGAQNSPASNRYWMGLSEATPDGYGIQTVWEFRNRTNTALAPDQWVRTFATSGVSTTYGAWQNTQSGLRRNVGVSIVTAPVGPTGATPVNMATVTIPFPVNGRRYRCDFSCYVQSDTVGGFSTVLLKYGLSATTTGTNITEMLKDHRTASRRETLSGGGEFTYGGTTGDSPFNVIAILLGGGGNSSTVATATQPQTLSVDEIVP